MNRIDELIKKLCPNGVEYKKLEDCCNILDNERKPVTKSARIKGEYPYYGANGIQDYVSDYIFDGTFVLVGEDGSVINKNGNPVVTWAEGKIWVNNHAHVIKEKENVLLRYLYHYIQTINVSVLIHGNIPKLNQGDFRNLRIAVPPLEVQCEIVHILDDFTLLSAELSAELKAREKQYDYYTEKIWSYLENEKRVRLDTICEIGDGLHGTPEYENNTKLWFVNGNNLENGRIIINKSTKEISNKSYNKYNGNYKIGTILMSINGTIGKIAYYTGEKIILGKSAAYFEVIEENTVCNKYLYYYLQSKKALQYFENNKTGSTIKNLGLKALREMKIPFPDRGKQEEIAGKLEKLDKLCNDISDGLPAEIEARQKQYEYYRDKLLTFKELKVNE